MRPLFTIPIPASRSIVHTGYRYVLPDQNGWSRYLHFQSAWLVVGAGLLYLISGFFRGHFRRNLLPTLADLSPKNLASALRQHLRLKRPGLAEAWSYNVLQRVAYIRAGFRNRMRAMITGRATNQLKVHVTGTQERA